MTLYVEFSCYLCLCVGLETIGFILAKKYLWKSHINLLPIQTIMIKERQILQLLKDKVPTTIYR